MLTKNQFQKSIAKNCLYKFSLIIQPILVLVWYFLLRSLLNSKIVGVTLMEDNHVKDKQIKNLRDCIYLFV